ncbi:hypothetical protein [Hymenobacter jejuensis]|uniref:Uncharacterized protein n=1 Tax=Hymenobacter jejuensis TaxID=2502781 RepID=A0A5B8A0R4_9BACT|nr:hypothetical protein [Hymenobacter jejuensis]QDA60910.1 hypothetical protein FHG12_12695 [Hymenobacter jejuensis]
MPLRKIYVLAGLLLCSAPVFAQSAKKNSGPSVPEGKVALPVTPALPGEEKLTARERAERDFLMPVRRKRAAALKPSATDQASATDITAHAAEEAEEIAPAEEAAASKTTATHNSHRRRSSSSHGRSTAAHSSARKKTSAKKSSSKKSSSKKSTAKKSTTHHKTTSSHRRR